MEENNNQVDYDYPDSEREQDDKDIINWVHSLILQKKYIELINFNLVQWYGLCKSLNKEIFWKYNLYIWIAYQEIWHFEKADVYFDNYLSLLTPKYVLLNLTEELKKAYIELDDYSIRFNYFLSELNDLWISYKVKKADYLL